MILMSAGWSIKISTDRCTQVFAEGFPQMAADRFIGYTQMLADKYLSMSEDRYTDLSADSKTNRQTDKWL